MQVIDENGFLFGVINIIDALVVLLVAAVVIAGVALVLPGEDEPQETRTIVFESTQQPEYVIDAVEEGPVPTNEIEAVESKTVINDGSRLRLQVRVNVDTTGDGLPRFKGERIYIGRQMELDLGSTIVNGTVVELRP